jgi:hypothetical protein
MIRVRFRIHQRRRLLADALALMLLPVGLLTTLTTMDHAHAAVSGAPATVGAAIGTRRFYLTTTVHNGAQASTACAKGYHFASIWEIVDPSALEYNTSLGRVGPDSGNGPPTQSTGFMYSIVARGWVRTGYTSSTAGTPGRGNCAAWSSSSSSHSGTVANLPSDWMGGEQDAGVWNADVAACDTFIRVWCVQDDSVLRVFLPLVLGND